MESPDKGTHSVEVVTITLNPTIDQTITVPNFAAGKVNRVQQSRSDPGGKGVNVASILSDYGHQVAVTGFLGRDNAGLFEAMFSRKGILDCFVRIAGQTRVAVKVADPVNQQTTDINFPGQAPGRGDLDALFRRLATLRAEWFVLAGSLPPGLPVTIYRDLALALKAQGHKVALDTSGDALRYGLEAVPHIMKPNVEELATLAGRPLTTPAEVLVAAQALLGRDVQMVVVSMGEEGALFVSPKHVLTARPPRVTVASTAGAGDALVAGIVVAQLEHAPLATCARLATAFALDAITHLGSGLSSVAAVQGFVERVTVVEGCL
jgi:1-phosphofructokinase